MLDQSFSFWSATKFCHSSFKPISVSLFSMLPPKVILLSSQGLIIARVSKWASPTLQHSHSQFQLAHILRVKSWYSSWLTRVQHKKCSHCQHATFQLGPTWIARVFMVLPASLLSPNHGPCPQAGLSSPSQPWLKYTPHLAWPLHFCW